MDSLFSPAVCAVPRVRLMRHAGALAAFAACLFVLPAQAEVTPDSAGLDLPDVKAINNQPIAKPTRGAITTRPSSRASSIATTTAPRSRSTASRARPPTSMSNPAWGRRTR